MSRDNTTGGAIVPAVKGGSVTIGSRGLAPVDLDGLWRVAQYVAASGLAPKGVDTPEAVFVAMEMGLELGLPLMASLQNIAVVNGRPTLWGDSQLAVVRSTGELEEFSEWYEVNGKRVPRNPSAFDDSTTAVCRVKRRGMEATESAFSVADAKRAGLWNKAGTWSQYPARMMRFRARSFALRDQFGDALKGLLSTEEAGDIPVEVHPTAPVVTVARPVFASTAAIPAERPPIITVNDNKPIITPAPSIATGGAGGSVTPMPTQAQVERVREMVFDAPAPAPAPAVEAAPTEPTETPQQRLAALVTGEGITFDQFTTFLEHYKYDTKGAASFDELPTAIASRLAKSERTIPALKAFITPA